MFMNFTEDCALAICSFILMCKNSIWTPWILETRALPEYSFSMNCSIIYHHHCPITLTSVLISFPLALAGPQIFKKIQRKKAKIIFTNVFVKEEMCSLWLFHDYYLKLNCILLEDKFLVIPDSFYSILSPAVSVEVFKKYSIVRII